MIRILMGAAALGVLSTTLVLAEETDQDRPPPQLGTIAEKYVKLALAMGEHDPDYVDAYYGPAEWKTEALAAKKSVEVIHEESMKLCGEAARFPLPADGIEVLRLNSLRRQLSALETRARMVQGEKLKFDEEARALYDATPPKFPESHFEAVLAKLGPKLPGKGSLLERYENWRKAFVIPNEKLDAVFQLAIKACRERTVAQIKLPPNESFTVEYVTDKPWSGYNWYKGDFRSVIQVNTDLPSYIDRAIDLAAHEGYPGHHVYNALLEKNLLRDRGWVEFSIYPLFSPQSLIAEGTANFGRDVVFTRGERAKFEQEVLWPAAGLDPKRWEEFYEVQDLTKQLGYAANEAARQLVDGEIDGKAAEAWLQKYALMDEKRARQRVKFIERYRSYVINYNVGEDLARNYIEKRGGTESSPDKRWEEFEQLLSLPRLPSALQ